METQHTVRIAFLDVGQGDSTIITIPETHEAIVIDCPEADVVFEYLQAEKIKHLRGLLITHFHLDHYREAVELLENCSTRLGLECERFVFNWPSTRALQQDSDADGHDQTNSTQRRNSYNALLEWTRTADNVAKCRPLLAGDSAQGIIGTFVDVIEILQPYFGQIGSLQVAGLNNTCAIIKSTGDGTTALLTGDIEQTGWQYLKGMKATLQSDVLKFPHHGAWKGADPGEILDVTKPALVIISVGTDGIRYSHPNSSVFNALRKRSEIKFMCTQATNQCSSNISSLRLPLVKAHREAADRRPLPFIRTSSGCPCAGTIVIELGAAVSIVQPEQVFHRDNVIGNHFGSPQCCLAKPLTQL